MAETDAERDQRVRKAQDDRAKRDEKAPLTGALTVHDVFRHLVNHGPARNVNHEHLTIRPVRKSNRRMPGLDLGTSLALARRANSPEARWR